MRYRAQEDFVSTTLEADNSVLNFGLSKAVKRWGLIECGDPQHFATQLIGRNFPVVLFINLMRHEQAIIRLGILGDDFCIRLDLCRSTRRTTRTTRSLHSATRSARSRTTRSLSQRTGQHGHTQNSTKYQLSLHDETSFRL